VFAERWRKIPDRLAYLLKSFDELKDKAIEQHKI